MTPEMKRALPTGFLVIGLLLLTAAGIFCALVPVVRAPKCPAPKATPTDEPVIFFPDGPTLVAVPKATPDPCGDGIRITLISRWLGRSWWEGSTIGVRASRGFRRTNSTAMLDRTGIRIHGRISKNILEDARAALLETGEFRSVEIEVSHYPEDPGKVKVRTIVVEK